MDDRTGEADSSSGDAHVEAVLATLDRLGEVPVAEHSAVYLDILERLGRELNPEQTPHRAGAHGPS